MDVPRTRRHPALPLISLVAGLVALCTSLAACQGSAPSAVDGATRLDVAARTAADMALQADDRVDLALYFRSGSGEGAHLVRVVREVEVGDDLPRRAVELLLAGPTPEDGVDLTAPLPPATRLLDLRLTEGTARVDLSREVITRSGDVGAQPANELLALAALADTLTEFPGIEMVRLSVEGQQVGRLDGIDGIDVAAFWGGWGLPEQLVRDEDVIGPAMDGLAVPDLDSFTRRAQQVPGDETAAVTVRSIRVRDQTAYTRLVVEVGDATNPAATAAAPPASVWVSDDRIVLTVEQVAEYAAAAAVGQRLEVGDPTFDTITVEREPGSGTLAITVTSHATPEFWLHNLTSPTRVVLDVRK